jgi:transcriptional regulator with XRE-family HTH domain
MAARTSTKPPRTADTGGVPLDLVKVRELREKRGLTMEQAATKAGMPSRQRWYEIESGAKPNITIDTLDKMATALGVKARDLLTK